MVRVTSIPSLSAIFSLSARMRPAHSSQQLSVCAGHTGSVASCLKITGTIMLMLNEPLSGSPGTLVGLAFCLLLTGLEVGLLEYKFPMKIKK